MSWKKMTIGKRITLGFGMTLILLVVVGLLSYFGVDTIVSEAKEVISGNQLVREEFIRLVARYGLLPQASLAIGAADPALSPAMDILGKVRSATPDLGAYEYQIDLSGMSGLTSIFLHWSQLNEIQADHLSISYTINGTTHQIQDIPVETLSYLLTDLVPYSIYYLQLNVNAEDGTLLAQSTPLVLMTTGNQIFLPSLFGIFPWLLPVDYPITYGDFQP